MRKAIPIASLIVAAIAVAVAWWWLRLPPETREYKLPQSKQFTKVPVEGMVTMVDLGAGTCIPCKMMAPAFEQAARELEPQMQLVKIKSEVEQTLGAQLGIRSIPTLALFQHGREVAHQPGAMGAAEIVR